MKLSFIGATQTVTGSMILGRVEGFSFLVDAGLYQGEDTPELDSAEKELEKIINIKELDAIFLTHAHLDHCGYIPRLTRLGFKGKIYCTEHTKAIAKVIMSDNARIQQDKVKKHNKKTNKEKQKLEPFYSLDDVTRSLSLFSTVNYTQDFVVGGIRVNYIRSGHILGAASILMNHFEKSFLFSGDLGREHDPIHRPKEFTVPKADYLILESTYGNRVHPRSEIPKDKLTDQLKEHLKSALKNKECLLIPAFSFGRSQIILSLLCEVFNEDKSLKMPIYLDSPMSSEILEIYEKSLDELTIDSDHFSEMKSNVRILEYPKERESILQKEKPHIILTSSGMVSGGPVLYYLEKLGGLEDTHILITGYQARGTYGYEITHENMKLMLNEKEIEIRAKVTKLEGLSSHADQNELINFVQAYKPKKVFLVHGEDDAKNDLKDKLSQYKYDAEIPSFKEAIEID